MFCKYHNKRIAIFTCYHCHAPICNECQSYHYGHSLCPECAEKAKPVVTPESPIHRNIFIALLLALFFPGMGQVYNGQLAKGLVVLVTAVLILPWVYGILDAGITAYKINTNTLHLKPSETTIAGCLAVYILLIASPLLGYRIFKKQFHGFLLNRQETEARSLLVTLSEGIESYARENGQYPEKFSDLYFTDPPYVDGLYCDVTIDHYTYRCDFNAKGYSVTATPDEGMKLKTLGVATGGKIF